MHLRRSRKVSFGKGGSSATRQRIFLLLAVCLAHLMGCATTSHHPVGTKAEPLAPSVDAGQIAPAPESAALKIQEPPAAGSAFLNNRHELSYKLRSGDSVTIRFLHNAELNVEVAVRPDGKVTLPLLGDVYVEGLTVPEMHANVSQGYKTFIRETSYGELLKESDVLEFRFVYNPELNITVRVRSDGKISLPMLGDIQAAGIRPDNLRKSIAQKYAAHIKNPDVALLVGETTAKKVFADPEFITVALLKPADQEIFVGGEVQAPKVVKFDGQITTLQAIMKAGGVRDTGDLSKVVVLRRGKFENPEWIQLNLSKPLSGESIHNDIPLKNGDVVVIPMTGIAKVDLFVRQYIREVLPIQSFFNVTVIPLDAGAL